MFLQLLTAAWCDESFTSSSGTITSPSLRFSPRPSYSPNLDCQYDIQVNNGSGIKLQWLTFDVKGKMPDCSEDYVEIYVGCGRHSIGRYCSDNIGGNLPFEVYSPDNCLRLKFHSDNSSSGLGFRAYYSAFRLSDVMGLDHLLRKEEICYDPKTLSCTSGVITSPEWPIRYPDLKDCFWKIDVGGRRNIKIAFMDFDLEKNSGCDGDKDKTVQIKEGDDDDSYNQSTTRVSVCGQRNPFYFTSTKEGLWIRFKSGSHYSRRGFVAGYVMYDSIATSGISGGSIAAIVLGVTVVFAAAFYYGFYYQFVYKTRHIRRVQEQPSINEPPQELTAHQPSYPPKPDDAPLSLGFAPPLQPEYAPFPQGNESFPQPDYAFPPQPDYVPFHQPDYAPLPYSHDVKATIPQQECATQVSAISILLALSGVPLDYLPEQRAKRAAYYRSASRVSRHSHYPRSSGGGILPYPLEQPKRVSLVPPVQLLEGTRPAPSAPPVLRDPPYPIESHKGTALHIPGQPERVFPYPTGNFPDGASPFYSVTSVSSHLPYSLQPHRGTALDAPIKPGGLPSYTCEQLPSGSLLDHTVIPVSTNPLHHPESDEEKELDASRQPGGVSPYLCVQPSNDTTPHNSVQQVPPDPHCTPESVRGTVLDSPTPRGSVPPYFTEPPPEVPQVSRDSPYPQESIGGKALDSLTPPGRVPPYPTEKPSDDAAPDHLVPLVLSDPPYISESGGGAAPNYPTSTGGVPPYPTEQPPDDATPHHSVPLVLSDPPYPSETGGGTATDYPTPPGGVPSYPLEQPPGDVTSHHSVPAILNDPPCLSESGGGTAPGLTGQFPT